jgi:MFS family permease
MSRGVVASFGEFQTFYTISYLKDDNPSSIAWIGSTQACLVMLTGLVSGPLYDKGHIRYLLGGGSLLIIVGFVMTSLCKQLWQLVLAQGLCTGLGFGLIFVPSIAVLNQYFSSKKALANGVASIGSGIGMWFLTYWLLQTT